MRSPRPNRLLLVGVAAGLAALAAGCGGATGADAGRATNVADQQLAGVAPAPLRVLAIQARETHGLVAPTSPITVALSAPLAAVSVHPRLVPPVAGRWTQSSPTDFTFTPTSSLPLGATLAVSVPGGGLGLLARDGAQLPATVTRHLLVAAGSVLRLQQDLATLGYLPLQFHPAAPVAATFGAQLAAAVAPPNGSFSWRDVEPASLSALWAVGADNTMTRGAVMDFEYANGLVVDGVAGPQVWTTLIQAMTRDQRDPAPYSYVLVNKATPQNATVYENGHAVFSTAANTGIPQSPTPDGTWPIYLRFTSTTMSGTNPDGSHYHDTGIPWVSYFNAGDALHGFLRASYGFAQSLGCVEMPYAAASVVWHDVNYGTLVTVVG